MEGGVGDDRQVLLPGNIYQEHLKQSVTGKGKCEPFHTEYDIFHGIVGKGFLRVLYIRVDDDQIVRLHRHLFILYIEGSLTPQDIEQF